MARGCVLAKETTCTLVGLVNRAKALCGRYVDWRKSRGGQSCWGGVSRAGGPGAGAREQGPSEVSIRTSRAMGGFRVVRVNQ